MPWPSWAHECPISQTTERGGKEICPKCGQRGQFEGWHYSVVEFMGVYSRRTGLAPFGPHRKLADELIQSRMKKCERCGGSGMLDVNNGESWRTCPDCHGLLAVFDGSPEELEELRQKVLAVFPEAAPGSARKEEPAQTPPAEGGFTGGGFFRPKPKDRSLQAYKGWMNSILAAVESDSEDDGSMTEEKWVESWKEFWSKMDEAKDKPDPGD